ncbi:MAG: hypothetical protein PF541_04285, partial [Prolixibacteraceae bacterium]|nr:hypothetical protein [Prolixibacteraceae bacterium]
KATLASKGGFFYFLIGGLVPPFVEFLIVELVGGLVPPSNVIFLSYSGGFVPPLPTTVVLGLISFILDVINDEDYK